MEKIKKVKKPKVKVVEQVEDIEEVPEITAVEDIEEKPTKIGYEDYVNALKETKHAITSFRESMAGLPEKLAEFNKHQMDIKAILEKPGKKDLEDRVDHISNVLNNVANISARRADPIPGNSKQSKAHKQFLSRISKV